MVRKIVWTIKAKSRYKEVIDYLLIEWGDTTALRFSKIVDRKLYLLARFPNLGISSPKMIGLRSFLLTKHNRLVYSIHKNEIHLHEIYDTRQERKNLL
jgi:plasmid stabilization system protein ParE